MQGNNPAPATFGGYLDAISRATGVKHKPTLAGIEALMRTQQTTLDSLTRGEFDGLARACHQASTYRVVA